MSADTLDKGSGRRINYNSCNRQIFYQLNQCLIMFLIRSLPAFFSTIEVTFLYASSSLTVNSPQSHRTRINRTVVNTDIELAIVIHINCFYNCILFALEEVIYQSFRYHPQSTDESIIENS